ncbi:MAG: PQQ-binding-like beta-propeller repeat protein, partial [Planctomycetales bacterium]
MRRLGTLTSAVGPALILAILSMDLRAEDWPQFRGHGSSGVASGTAKLPAEIGPETNVIWRTPVARGLSSPVVFGDRVYLTALDEKRLLTLAFDRADGKKLWEAEAPYEKLEKVHRIGSPATSSVATDGERVVSFFGSCGLFCHDVEGKLLWRKTMGPFDNGFGAASSPVLFEDRVIVLQDHDTGSFLATHDKETGETLWRTERENSRRNYSTPVVWMVEGKPQIVVAGTAQVTGYDMGTGELIWFARGMARVVSSTPVVGDDGILYVVNSGGGGGVLHPAFDEVLKTSDKNENGVLEPKECPKGSISSFFGQFDRDKNGSLDRKEYESIRDILGASQSVAMAVKPGGRGDVTESHVLWTRDKSIPRNASPVCHRGTLYMVKDGGVVTCLDAKTGEILSQERAEGTGKYSSSPSLGDGKLYLFSERGELSVITAEPEWKLLASADFKED